MEKFAGGKKEGGFFMGTKVKNSEGYGLVWKNQCGNGVKRNRKVLLMLKRLPLLQFVQFLQQEAFFQPLKLLRQQGKLQQNRRLNNTARLCKSTSSIVGDSQQQNKDYALYGKNQFSIRYRQTGTDHTLSVSPALIRGEPILRISALKVPLCHQRFLRVCPMYLSHTVQTEKKVEKETQVTSVPGNKTAVAAAVACCASVAIALGAVTAEKRTRLKLCEKSYEIAVSELEENNKNQMSENGGLK